MSAVIGAVTTPATKAARQARITYLLSARTVRSQAELVSLLAKEGLPITQATLSRDLEEIGAAKTRASDGSLVYALPDADRAQVGDVDQTARLARALQDLLISAEAAGNVVVLRTPPAGANLLASAVDRAGLAGVAGTVAGDDTVLIVCRAPAATEASAMVTALTRLAESRAG